MMDLLKSGRNANPALRGALFYGGFYAAVGILSPYIYIYFSNLGMDGRQIGLLAMIGPVLQLFYTPLYSGFADRRGWRVRMLAFGLFGVAFAYLLMGIPRTFLGILLAVGLASLFAAPVSSLADSLLARMSALHRLDYGRMRMFGSLGYAVISLSAGLLWKQIGFGWMFAAAFVIYGIVGFFSLLLTEIPAAEPHASPPYALVARHPVLRTLLLATVLMGGAMMTGITFNGVYMKHLGGGEDMVGLMAAGAALIELPVMLYSMRIIKKLGSLNTLLLGYILYMVSCILAGMAQSPWVFAASGAIRAPGFSLFIICTVVLLDRYSGEWSATTQALMTAGAYGLAPLIAYPISGWLFDLWGPEKVYFFAASLVATAIVILVSGLVIFRPRELTERI